MPRLNDLKRWSLSIVGVALLAACHGGKPTGQVVAKVAGDEITTSELRLELAQMNGGDPAMAQQRALAGLITRKLMVREAVARKLDTTPAAQAATKRARELALVDLLNAKYASQQPTDTSDTAVYKFISAHPSQFANRKLVAADQLNIATNDASLGPKLQAMPDVATAVAYLTDNNITFVRAAAIIDTAELPNNIATQIGGLTNNSLYATPLQGGVVRLLRVMSAQDAPLFGNDARQVALRLMEADRSKAALGAIQQIVAKARAKAWVDPAFAPG